MRERNVDWEIVARKMMYDFRVFNAEICDVPDTEESFEAAAAENFDAESFVEELTRSPSVSRPTSEPSTPIKRGYEADPGYEPEAGEAGEVEEALSLFQFWDILKMFGTFRDKF